MADVLSISFIHKGPMGLNGHLSSNIEYYNDVLARFGAHALTRLDIIEN